MFKISYIGGGVLDKVRELPYPHFSKYTVPYIKGRTVIIPEMNFAQSRVDTYSLPFGTEFLSIAVGCSVYCDGDYWELTIGNNKVCDSIYTKDIPESVSMGNSFGIVYPIEPNTVIKFEYFNISKSAKTVWYNVKFLKG